MGTVEPLLTWKVDTKQYFTDYVEEELIERTEYSTSYKGKWSSDGQAVVIRKFLMEKESMKAFEEEAAARQRIAFNPLFLKYLGHLELGHYVTILEPLQPLHTAIRLTSFSWNEIWKIAADVSSGLQYLHNNGIIHCDLNSYNIYLENTPFRAKV